MKRCILSGIVGLAVVSAFTASGQGGINFANFDVASQTYNPIVWGPNAVALGFVSPGPVRSTDGVTLYLWYAPTGQTLQQGPALTLIGDGYYTVSATLTGWAPGQTWDFQLQSSLGPFWTGSTIWQENADIANIAFTPPNPPPLPGSSHNFIGFVLDIPEPSTLALATCGLAGLWISRRRK